MSSFLERVTAAEEEVRGANRDLAAAKRDRNGKIKEIEKSISSTKRKLTRSVDAFRDVRLTATTIACKGKTYSLSSRTIAEINSTGSVYTTVSSKNSTGVSVTGALIGGAIAGPIGAVVAGKKDKTSVSSKVHDDRKLFFCVSCDDGAFSTEIRPEEEKGAFEFLALVRSTAASADALRETVERETAELGRLLEERQADTQEIDRCTEKAAAVQKTLDDLVATASPQEKEEYDALKKKRTKRNMVAAAAGVVIVLLLGGLLFSQCSREQPADNRESSIAAEDVRLEDGQPNEPINAATSKPKTSSSSASTAKSELDSKQDETKAPEEDGVKEMLDAIDNTPATEILPSLLDKGYTVASEHASTGGDFTYDVASSVENPDQEYALNWIVTGYKKLDTDKKTVTLLVTTQNYLDEQEQKDATQKALENKLDPFDAWEAVQRYGEHEFPYGFEVHSTFGLLAETPEDESTWFLKATCTVTGSNGANADGTVEARITGTSDNPEVIGFYVY